jgi:1D-myo-inositol 3-kinase
VSILIAGHYCHDTLIGNDGEHRALGGSAAYASAVLEAFGERYDVAANVGADFRYFNEVLKPPRVAGPRTTSFIEDYRSAERREQVDAVCAPLEPRDLGPGPHQVGIACAIAGEVPPRTLQHMRATCRVMLADAQGLLRRISPQGEVLLEPLHADAPAQLDYLKASKSEAELLDVELLRRQLIVLITDGPRGCTLLSATDRLHIPAYPAKEKDPTGAGDCFLAGFAVGLSRKLPVEKALRLGAWCGARAVEHIGVPRITKAQARQALEATT